MPLPWEAWIFSRERKFLVATLIDLHWLQRPKKYDYTTF